MPRLAALLTFALCLALGYLAGTWLHPTEVSDAALASQQASQGTAEARRLNDRINGINSELATLRATPAAKAEPPPALRSPTGEAWAPPRATPPRIDAVRLLRNQGATVSVRIFTGATATVVPAAKIFFNLTDAETDKLSAAFERAKKATDEGATASASITQTTDNSLTILVPAFDGGSAIFARFASDLEAALGADRGKELLEIGADEFTSTLDSAGTGARTVTVTRVVPTALPNGNLMPIYRMTEPIARGMRMSSFNAPGDNGANSWLSRFQEQLTALKPREQP